MNYVSIIIVILVYSCFEGHNGVYYDISRSTVYSIQVRGDMSGIWECRIEINQLDEQFKPIEYYYTDRYDTSRPTIYCYLNVHVRLMETPQIVLINNMIAPTTQIKDTKLPIDYTTGYKFLDGESVDVACIPENSLLSEDSATYNYSITFEYDYAEKLDDMFKNARTPNGLGYRFRTTLRTDYHHNSKMICKCDGPKGYTIIEVTFSALNHLDDCDYIEMNGLKSRPLNINSDELGFVKIKLQYLFLEDQEVNWVCNESYQDCQKKACVEEISKTTTNRKKLKTPFNFTCILCYNERVEHVLGIVNKMSSHFKERTMLHVNLPKDNSFLELHKLDLYGTQSWIYYEFDENYNFPLHCTIEHTKVNITEEDILLKRKLNGEGTEETNMTLTFIKDGSLFECYVVEKNYPVALKHSITVLFRKKYLTTTTLSTMPPGVTVRKSGISNKELPYIGGGVVAAIVVSLLVTIYIKRWRWNNVSTPQVALVDRIQMRPLPELPLHQLEPKYDCVYPVDSDIDPQPLPAARDIQNTHYYWSDLRE